MKTQVKILFLLMAVLLVVTGCSSTPTPTAAPTTAVTDAPAATDAPEATDAAEAGTEVFTVDELKTYNGKDGARAYVAVDGTVYDVTDVPEWANGEHNGIVAGTDVTKVIKDQSPHGTKVLDGLVVVGTLE